MPQVFIHNCTLVLPWSDYAALLSAALRWAVAHGSTPATSKETWKAGAVATAPILQGITTLVVSPLQGNLSESSPYLLVASYSGWGVNATATRFVPEPLVGPRPELPDWTPPAAPAFPADTSSGGGSSQQVALGLGIGVGVGGALLLAAALGCVVVHKRREARERAEKEKEEAATTALGVGDTETG
jgi:hypothetical protein